jgi:septal ring factor EnvC (AmiA/AmiB activator)
MSKPTDLERTNLEAHVDMCAQRYESLDRRLTNVENELKKIGDDIKTGNSSLIKVIVGTTGTIIAGLLSTVVVVMLKF